MLRIDGAYLYELGADLRRISELPAQNEYRFNDLIYPFWRAKDALHRLFYQSVFTGILRNSFQAADKILTALKEIVPDDLSTIIWDQTLDGWRIESLKADFSKLEAILTAELQVSALYFASPKGGFDTACLTHYGENLFPQSLGSKVPGALPDVRAGARCLAFELPSAAGFHFHRANEAVLRRYFDEVAGEDKRPASRSMGEYINKMEHLKVGDSKVLEVLRSLKDLHRNPLMHPDQSIETTEEAISLLSAIRAAVGYMLDRIPDGALPPAIARLPLGETTPIDV
jgi:hypothetical protein